MNPAVFFTDSPCLALLLCHPDLSGNETLEELDLSDCSLGDDCAIHLAAIMGQNLMIRRLKLANNNFSWVGAR